MIPENFSIELEKTTAGRWWAFVVVENHALFAGFSDSPQNAARDALAAAERNGWRNQFRAPAVVYEPKTR
jgi:hypothetical protein